jgi:hypothetical protein
MMVMFILTILLGAVFGIVRATVELSNDMSETQLAEARVNGFAQFCERTLRNLPAGALVRHRTKQQGSHYLSQLAFKGAPAAFVTQGSGGNEVIVLETEEQVDGYLRVILRSMTAAQVLAWEQGNAKAGRRLPLLEDVAAFEWRFYRVQSGEWEPVWNDRQALYPLGVITANPAPEDQGAGGPPPQPGGPGLNPAAVIPRAQRPLIMELRMTMAGGNPLHWTFWVPPAEPPTTTNSAPPAPVLPPQDSPTDPMPAPAPAPAPEPPP